MSTAQARGLNNLQVRRDHIIVLCPNYPSSQILTGDVNVFDFTDNRKFDRVLSIEVRRSFFQDMSQPYEYFLIDVRAHEEL